MHFINGCFCDCEKSGKHCEDEDREDNPEVPRDQACQGHAASTLGSARLGDPSPGHVPQDDRGYTREDSNSTKETQDNGQDPQDQAGDCHPIWFRGSTRVLAKN